MKRTDASKGTLLWYSLSVSRGASIIKESTQSLWEEIKNFYPNFSLSKDELVYKIVASGEKGALFVYPSDIPVLAVMAYAKFWFPREIFLSPKGSMFVFKNACAFLQNVGLPIDPWFLTNRNMYQFSPVPGEAPLVIEAHSSQIEKFWKVFLGSDIKEKVATLDTSIVVLEQENFNQSLVRTDLLGKSPVVVPIGQFPENRLWRRVDSVKHEGAQ